jgi:hypothetical protein
MPFQAQQIRLPGLLAGADLSSGQYKCVELCTTAGEVSLVSGSATGTTAPILGILQNDPEDGEEASVCILGLSIAVCGTGAGITQANLEAGGAVSANSTGIIHTVLDNTHIVGYAVETASASGDLVTIIVNPQRF